MAGDDKNLTPDDFTGKGITDEKSKAFSTDEFKRQVDDFRATNQEAVEEKTRIRIEEKPKKGDVNVEDQKESPQKLGPTIEAQVGLLVGREYDRNNIISFLHEKYDFARSRDLSDQEINKLGDDGEKAYYRFQAQEKLQKYLHDSSEHNLSNLQKMVIKEKAQGVDKDMWETIKWAFEGEKYGQILKSLQELAKAKK